jgi:predicted phosphate transport protein (TIGR00153 family)
MFARFMPQEGKFFDLFNAHAELIVQGGKALSVLVSELGDSREEALRQAKAIDEIESRADRITHETIQLLHKTFITPLGREEIHGLITAMDDILDLTQDVAQSVTLYDIRRLTEQAKQLADICLSCGERVRSAVSLLPNMENGSAILQTCQQIDRLESDADRVMRAAMSKLFRDEPDTRQLIKLKEIYELLEAITDRCEDVANLIEGIVLENS